MNGRDARSLRVVNDLGDEVLAGAALAGEQHRRRGADRDAGDQVPQRGDRRRRPDDPLQAVRPRRVRAELPHLAPQPRRLERAFHRRRDVVEVERLVGEVIGAELHRLDGGLDAGVRRQQDDQDVLIELLDLAQDRDAVGVGQPIVEQHEIDALGQLARARRVPVSASSTSYPSALRRSAERPADQGFVVDDEDRWLWAWCGSARHVSKAECSSGADSNPSFQARFCGTAG